MTTTTTKKSSMTQSTTKCCTCNNKSSKYKYWYIISLIGCLFFILRLGIGFVAFIHEQNDDVHDGDIEQPRNRTRTRTRTNLDTTFLPPIPIHVPPSSLSGITTAKTAATTLTTITSEADDTTVTTGSTAALSKSDTTIDDDSNNNHKPIELLVPEEEAMWIRDRNQLFQDWFTKNKNSTMDITTKNPKSSRDTKLLRHHADADVPGAILDFLIVGSAKTGTTTLMDNLSHLAPMPPAKDICYSPENIIQMAYKSWPEQYNSSLFPISFSFSSFNTSSQSQQQQRRSGSQLSLKGNKCPSLLGLPMLKRYAQCLPKTKLIIGIRHPISWFQSFWKMQGNDDPYDRVQLCPCPPHDHPTRNNLFRNDTILYDSQTRRCTITTTTNETQQQQQQQIVVGCKNECGKKLFCTARARFHVAIARLGKTLLSFEERKLLAPNDPDGGMGVTNGNENNHGTDDNTNSGGLIGWNITNAIFIYDQTQLQEQYLWDGLASFLQVSYVPNTKRRFSHGKNKTSLDICAPKYDYFRSIMMKSSYEMSLWFERYLLPISEDSLRSDVTIMNPNNAFYNIIQSYKLDPCERLVRVGVDNGTGTDDDNNSNYHYNYKYILDPIKFKNTNNITNNMTTTTITTRMIPPPDTLFHQKYDYNIRTVSDDDGTAKLKRIAIQMINDRKKRGEKGKRRRRRNNKRNNAQ